MERVPVTRDALGRKRKPGAPGGPRVPARRQRSVRRGWGLALLLAAEAVCALGKGPFVGPARSRCASPGGGSPRAGSPADQEHWPGCGRPACRRRSGGCGGKGRSRARLPWGLALHEAPEFIECEHVAVLAGQERVLEGGQSGGFFPPPRPPRSGSARRRCVGCRACSCDPGRRPPPAP